MKKEFEVGDKVVIEGKIIYNNQKRGDYPIGVQIGDDDFHPVSFNEDGRYKVSDNEISLFHAEDNKKPEYPKWMMVSNDNINWCKRYVIAKHDNIYIVIEN